MPESSSKQQSSFGFEVMNEVVPGNEMAKGVLIREFCLFRAQEPKLPAQPVLLISNCPDGTAELLASSLAESVGLPMVRATLDESVDSIVANLHSRSGKCVGALGVAVVCDLQSLSPSSAKRFADAIQGRSPVRCSRNGRVELIYPTQIFWVGVFHACVPSKVSSITGSSVSIITGEGIAALVSQVPESSPAETTGDRLQVLESVFPSNGWIVSPKREDFLTAFVSDAVWSPVARFRNVLSARGTILNFEPGADELLADSAMAKNCGLPGLFLVLREILSPILAVVMAGPNVIDSVTITTASVDGDALPEVRLREGGSSAQTETRSRYLVKRPGRISTGQGEARLARIGDLSQFVA